MTGWLSSAGSGYRSSSPPCLPFLWCRLIHAVEVASESIYVSGPDPAELSQPVIHLLEWFRFQPSETPLLRPPWIPRNRPLAARAGALTRSAAAYEAKIGRAHV